MKKYLLVNIKVLYDIIDKQNLTRRF